MPVSTVFAPDGDHTSVLATLHILVHDVLPACALAFGLMAVIWLSCTVVTISGAVLGSWIILGTRGLIHTCTHHVRHHRTTQNTPPDFVHSDAATTVSHLGYDQHRHPQPKRTTGEPTTEDESGSGDGPA